MKAYLRPPSANASSNDVAVAMPYSAAASARRSSRASTPMMRLSGRKRRSRRTRRFPIEPRPMTRISIEAILSQIIEGFFGVMRGAAEKTQQLR